METHGFWTELEKPLKLENFERLSPPQSNPRGAATCIYISALTCNMNLRLILFTFRHSVETPQRFSHVLPKVLRQAIFWRCFSALLFPLHKKRIAVAPLGLE